MSLEEIKKARQEKLAALQSAGIAAYPALSTRSHTIHEALEGFARLQHKKQEVTLVGRMVLRREHGGSAFFHFADATGKMQGYAKKDVLGEESYRRFLDIFDVGDFIEVTGTLFTTKKEEKTIEAHAIKMLAKSLRTLPEKWHGLTDTEERFRKRYLDMVMNSEVRERFAVHSALLAGLRSFFGSYGFLEVETPMLHTIPGGALARPFKTRMETLDLELYLRVAPELYLKRLLVGGFERVFEIGRCFRNEGMDKDHNPEFTMLEAYAAYQDYEWLMQRTEEMLPALAQTVLGKTTLTFGENEIPLLGPWPRVDFNEAVKAATGLDFLENSQEDYLAKAKELNITVAKTPSKSALLDEFFKKVVRPSMMNPQFVIDHPLELSPLSKTHRSDPRKVERFQLVIGGMEVANAFSELNDPQEQRKRFEAQEAERKKGDEESHRMDEDYVEALEYGMPPAAGIGIGVDRLARLFTDSATLREVLLFPTMKPRS